MGVLYFGWAEQNFLSPAGGFSLLVCITVYPENTEEGSHQSRHHSTGLLVILYGKLSVSVFFAGFGQIQQNSG